MLLYPFHDPFGNVLKVGMVIGPMSKVESIVVPQYIYSQPTLYTRFHTHTHTCDICEGLCKIINEVRVKENDKHLPYSESTCKNT
jgi:hypothetical protein